MNVGISLLRVFFNKAKQGPIIYLFDFMTIIYLEGLLITKRQFAQAIVAQGGI
jgi:hypothetical protein